MSAIWGLITGDLLPYIITAFTAMVGIGGAYFKGRSDAKAKAAVKDLKAHKETVERVLDETTSADPADDIRRRLRERAGKP